MKPISETSNVVAAVLSAHELPQLVELSEEEYAASSIQLTGRAFADTGAGDWLGFYDWLRSSAGEVIGVRQYVDDQSTFPLARDFKGVEKDVKQGVVRIFFGQSREFDEVASCDQDFGDNRLLAAGDEIALTFSARNLK